MLRPSLLLGSVLLVSTLARAQGTVQLRDPRRPPPLDPPPECELWRGHIAGNDPTAEATLQLCTSGDAVSGLFLWSSLESGWNRRRFAGRWLDAHQQLELHDTAMLENHPADGWRLCLADRYDLRRVNDTELAGEFWSEACSDHGTLRITRLAPTATPTELDATAPAVSVRRDVMNAPRRAVGCDVSTDGATGSASGVLGALLALAAISRSRCWRGRR